MHSSLAAVLQVREGACRRFCGNGLASPSPDHGRCPAACSPRGRRSRSRFGVISPQRSTSVRWRTSSSSTTLSDPARNPKAWELATAYLGLVPLGVDPDVPGDTSWHPVGSLPPTAFDHGAVVLAARDRLRGKLSYTNIGFALAPPTFTLAELRDVYVAALGT